MGFTTLCIIFTFIVVFIDYSYGTQLNQLNTTTKSQKYIGNNLEVRSLRKNTKFFLYTRSNPKVPQQLVINDTTSFLTSNFNAKNQIRILIFGFQGQPKGFFTTAIRDAYLKKGDFNVIVFDWSILANNPDYVKVITLLSKQAKILVEFTKFMNKLYNISYDSIYLIGFSLGAHLAGYTGRLLSPDKFNTIFLLDPAGPIFQETFANNHSVIAQSGDAKYVEAIHTDMGIIGYSGKMGDADFYPDFGRFQKNCLLSVLALNFSCDHKVAVEYFAETINRPYNWLGKKCDSFQDMDKYRRCNCSNNKSGDCNQKYQMGGEPSTPKKGVFYVDAKVRLQW